MFVVEVVKIKYCRHDVHVQCTLCSWPLVIRLRSQDVIPEFKNENVKEIFRSSAENKIPLVSDVLFLIAFTCRQHVFQETIHIERQPVDPLLLDTQWA